MIHWEFPGGPVVRILRFHCHGPGSIPGHATKILQAARHSQKQNTNQKKKKKFIHQIKLIIALITVLLWIVVGIKLVNIRKR